MIRQSHIPKRTFETITWRTQDVLSWNDNILERDHTCVGTSLPYPRQYADATAPTRLTHVDLLFADLQTRRVGIDDKSGHSS